MSKRKITIFILITIWFGVTVFLFWRSETDKRFKVSEVPIVLTGNIESESYRSIYFNGEKIGYSASLRQKVSSGLMLNETSYMRLPIGGAIQEINAELIVSTDDYLSIKNFSFSLSSDDYSSSVDGSIQNNELRVKIKTPENTSEQNFPIKGDIFLPSAASFIAAQDSFRKEHYTIESFNPMTMTMRNYTIQVVRKGTSPRGEKNVWLLYSDYNGHRSKTWVDSLGDVVHEEMVSGFTAHREAKDKALSFELNKSGSFDLLSEFAVRVKNPNKINIDVGKTAKFQLQGFDHGVFSFDDFNQMYDEESKILTVIADGFPDSMGLSPQVTPADTAQTPLIQKNDLRILRATQKIIGDETDSLQMLHLINIWLHEEIAKEYRSSIPSALDVLKQMVGDCNEHTTLFVAMARSIGIPSRVNVGIVFHKNHFLYHAWPQSYVNGRWFTFEPTFGTFPATALHIKLLHGELQRQIEIMRLNNPSITFLEIDGNVGNVKAIENINNKDEQ